MNSSVAEQPFLFDLDGNPSVRELKRVEEPTFRELVDAGVITAVVVQELPSGKYLVDGQAAERAAAYRLRVERGHDREFSDLTRLKGFLRNKLHVGRFQVQLSEGYNDRQMSM